MLIFSAAITPEMAETRPTWSLHWITTIMVQIQHAMKKIKVIF
jgi:hypothetical protein